MICNIICIDGFLCMLHLDIVHMLSAYVHVIHTLSGHMRIMCTSSAGRYIIHMSSAGMYVIQNVIRTSSTGGYIICMSSAGVYIICRHICHQHIICRTPHGQCGPELSFYCDRNWLLNGICHYNVELFHFRIM